MEKPKFNFSTPFIRFLGGQNILFLILLILLLGFTIWVYSYISFIFAPIIVFVQTVVFPVVLALIAFYLLRPILRLLEKAKIPRVWGILIIFLFLAGLITIIIVAIVPFLRTQFENLIMEFPNYLNQMIQSINNFVNNSVLNTYFQDFSLESNDLIRSLPESVSNVFNQTLTGVTSLISTITDFVLGLVTFPFILFYLLKDGEKLPRYVIKLLPPSMREDTADLLKQMDRQLSSYIQGQLMVAFCIGVMIYIGFLIIGMDYALLLASIAMVTSVVPYLGPIIAITPAIIIAIVTSPFMLVKLVIVWTVVQLLEGKLISPQIMGKNLHIHPITIIFVLLTAGHLFGVVGVVLGIPGYALLKIIVTHIYFLFRRRYNKYAAEPYEKIQ
ncbi:AI-2E family transporter [Jeotgalibacillus soli]|uniref:AI-2E family transporter n=1 Tax=Jeotgalibacillus soli TaxID=889306 RepID=A0A0C2W685_9BACL|nr:AI-2E family transporter [Jeotgalibacillus soli]KIL52081.1 hypothetical protein KP78_04510 [Jeotgalibacillus soli]